MSGREQNGVSPVEGEKAARLSERRRSEEALRQSEDRFRALVTASSDVVYRMSPDWSEMWALRGQSFIADTESANRQWLNKYIHPDDQPRVTAAINEAIRTKTVFELEHRVLRVDGSFGWTFSRAVPMLDARGDIVEWVGMAIDVTKRKESEDALRESEGRLRAIVETAVDAIITIDEHGAVTSLNPAARRLFGYAPDEVMGKNVNHLMPAPYNVEHDHYIDSYLTTGVKKIIGIGREVVGRRKDGSVFPMELAVSETVLGDRRIFTGIVRDISERKRAEESLARQAEELARSNVELERFAYVASHDLQEPMRTVRSFVQLLERRYGESLKGEAEEYFRFIVGGVQRMQMLINDLLTYSRVSSQGAAFAPSDCNQVIAKVLENLQASIQSHGAEITVDTLPTVMADATQLGQIFQNLLGNALKFHGRQPPKLRVSARQRGSEWVFSVKDNGIGIAPEYFERIFIIFQRLHTIEEYGGTGIGLAICKKIVERHGGRIWVESAPGNGSTFFFSLPRRERAV